MNRTPRILLFILGFSVICGLLVWHVSRSTVTLNPQIPASLNPEMQAVPKSFTSVTVPIAVPIQAVQSILDQKIPRTFKGSSGSEVVKEIGLSASARWNLARSTLLLSGRDGRLTGNVNLNGTVHVVAHLGSARATEKVSLGGHISMSTLPQVQPDWRLTVPDLQIRAILNKATIDISLPVVRLVPVEEIEKIPFIKDLPIIGAILRGVKKIVRIVMKPIEEITTFPISVRSVVRKYLDREVNDLRNDIVKQVSSSDSLRKAAKNAWNEMCTTIPVMQGLWLQIKPIGARISQPDVKGDTIFVKLGIDAETQITSTKVEPECPFPESAVIATSMPNKIAINLPAEVDYSVVREGLSGLLVGKSFGSLVSLTVKDVIDVRASGGSLILGIVVVVETDSWIRSRAEGTVYVLAKPQLDAEGEIVRFRDVRMDTASRDVLVDVAGELSEPFLERAVERYELDLGPVRDRVLGDANKAIEKFSLDGLKVSGRIDDVRLVGLEVGEHAVRLHGNAQGRISVVVAENP